MSKLPPPPQLSLFSLSLLSHCGTIGVFFFFFFFSGMFIYLVYLFVGIPGTFISASNVLLLFVTLAAFLLKSEHKRDLRTVYKTVIFKEVWSLPVRCLFTYPPMSQIHA